MIDPNLLAYIKDSFSRGRTEDVIRVVLLQQGWTQAQIDEAFASLKGAPAAGVVQSQSQPLKPSQQASILSSSANTSGGPNKKAIVIVALIILLLGAGTALGYFYYLRPQLTPDQVLANSFTAMQSVKTFSYALNMSSTIETPTAMAPPPPSEVAVSATASGTIDVSNLPSINESSIVTANIVSTATTTPTINTTAESVLLGGVYYIKLDSFDLGGTMGSTPNPFTAIISFFTNQWFEIDPTALAQTFLKGQADQIAKIQAQAQWSPGKIQQLRTMAEQDQIINIAQALPNEVVGGQDAYHYKLSVNKTNLDNFITAAYPIIYANSTSSLQAQLQLQIASATAALDNITYNDLEVWIGTKDFLVYKASADIAVAPAVNATNQTSYQFQLSESMGDYNQSSTIVAPTGAKDVNTILSGLFGGLIQSTSTPALDARRLSDLRETQNALELYYNQNGTYPIATTWAMMAADIERANIGVLQIPNTPVSGETYYYQSFADGSSYVLGAKLDNGNNPAFDNYVPPTTGVPSGMINCTAAKKEYCLSL